MEEAKTLSDYVIWIQSPYFCVYIPYIPYIPCIPCSTTRSTWLLYVSMAVMLGHVLWMPHRYSYRSYWYSAGFFLQLRILACQTLASTVGRVCRKESEASSACVLSDSREILVKVRREETLTQWIVYVGVWRVLGGRLRYLTQSVDCDLGQSKGWWGKMRLFYEVW